MATRRQGWYALSALILSTGLLACGGDDGDSPTVDGGEDVNCAEPTLSFALDTPSATEGFAPFTVEFTGQANTLQPVPYRWNFDFGDGTTLERESSTAPQIAATNVFTEPGTYTVTLSVIDTVCNQDNGPQSTTITVLAPVELVGRDFAGRPGNVDVGGEVRVSGDVFNESTADLSAPLTVELRLATRPAVAWNERELFDILQTVTIMPSGGVTIPAGGSITIDEQIVVPDVDSGSYYIAAFIDPMDVIGEENDESNNVAVTSAPIFINNEGQRRPDFVVQQVTLNPTAAFQTLRNVDITARFQNIGVQPSAAVDYTIYLQRAATGDEPPEFDADNAIAIFTGSTPQGLDIQAPDNVFDLNATFPVDPPISLEGDAVEYVYAFVAVDPNNAVEEASTNPQFDPESNNLAGSPTGVELTNEPPTEPDISVNSFSMAPPITFLDGTVQINLELANIGQEATGTFFCSVYLSEDQQLDRQIDTQLANINFANLPAQEVRTASDVVLVPGFFDVGVYTPFVVCDPFNVVREAFENNNILRSSSDLTVTAEAIIDISGAAASFAPETIDNGDGIIVSLTVLNDGTNGSVPAQGRI
ncbi:MAG: PKD domain-containing protein, partial [Myxococcota bacterium]